MWQPIETAPKDQTFLAVLNCAGQQTICTMRWAVAEEKNSRPDHYAFHVERVTHWMPLPDLPGAQPAPSIPEISDDLIEVIESRAEQSYRRHHGGIRGQQVTPADALSWHIIHATRDVLATAAPEAKP